MAEERIIRSEQIFSGKVVKLRIDTLARDDGRTYQREVIQHDGAVALVALDKEANVLLVRQYRAGAQKEILELPAGGLEPNEASEGCARRELQEEAGYYPERLSVLGGFYVAASYTTEYVTVYLAQDLRPSQLKGDTNERIILERVPLKDALHLALANQIEDGKTVIGLIWAAQRLGLLSST